MVFITRLLLMLYGAGILAGCIGMLAGIATGNSYKSSDVGNVLLWPLLVLTKKGRQRLDATFNSGESK